VFQDATTLREARALRGRVDAKLGTGIGLSLPGARDRLSPAGRME
jgi:hypothetical protein